MTKPKSNPVVFVSIINLAIDYAMNGKPGYAANILKRKYGRSTPKNHLHFTELINELEAIENESRDKMKKAFMHYLNTES